MLKARILALAADLKYKDDDDDVYEVDDEDDIYDGDDIYDVDDFDYVDDVEETPTSQLIQDLQAVT